MAVISRFFGIVIRMHFDDRQPPHCHALYAGREVVVGISPPRVLEGSIHPRAVALVMEWTELHRDELLDDWVLARDYQPLAPIEPFG